MSEFALCLQVVDEEKRRASFATSRDAVNLLQYCYVRHVIAWMCVGRGLLLNPPQRNITGHRTRSVRSTPRSNSLTAAGLFLGSIESMLLAYVTV